MLIGLFKTKSGFSQVVTAVCDRFCSGLINLNSAWNDNDKHALSSVILRNQIQRAGERKLYFLKENMMYI